MDKEYFLGIVRNIVYNRKIAKFTYADAVNEAIVRIGDPDGEKLSNGMLPIRRILKEALDLLESKQE